VQARRMTISLRMGRFSEAAPEISRDDRQNRGAHPHTTTKLPKLGQASA